MIEIDLDPVLLQVWIFDLTWHGLTIVVAIIVGACFTLRELSRKRVPIASFALVFPWVVVAGIVGARLLYVVDWYDYFLMHPFEIKDLNECGLADYGAVAAGCLVLAFFAVRKQIPLPKWLDSAAPALAAGQVIGRIGCLVDGCCWGVPTGAFWGITYANSRALIPPNLLNVPTHPVAIYEILWNSVGLILTFRFRGRSWPDGVTFLAYLVFYSAGRLLLTYYRQSPILAFGLRQAQVMAFATLCVAVPMVLVLVLSAKHGRPGLEDGQAFSLKAQPVDWHLLQQCMSCGASFARVRQANAGY